jgi:tripartite-type tricarboxylate transporter receptor subunit TctC
MRKILAVLAAVLCLATIAHAQDKFPSKPIRILVAFSPGSATDIMARLLAEQLRQDLKQTVIVENKPGAFGILAIEEMVRAKPDGYTLMLGNISTTVVTPIVYRKKFSIDPQKDVVAVSRIGMLYNFFNITAKIPPKTFAEFIAYAKERPGKILYATTGVGSYPHYDAEIFGRRLGIQWVHVPVKGGPPDYIKDMITGDIQAAFNNIASAAPFVKGGQLRAIATNSPQRLADYPDVPTMAELGYGDLGRPLWTALVAPAAAPARVLEQVNAAVQKSLAADELKKNFANQLIVPSPSGSLADTKIWLDGEFAKWKAITTEVKIDIPE